METFVYRKAPYWPYVCEATTGFAIAGGIDVRDAVKKSEAIIQSVGWMTFRRQIKKRIQEHGISPAFQTEVKNED
jgi:hypothetical protein